MLFTEATSENEKQEESYLNTTYLTDYNPEDDGIDGDFSFKVRHKVSKSTKTKVIKKAENNSEKKLKYRDMLEKYINTFILD